LRELRNEAVGNAQKRLVMEKIDEMGKVEKESKKIERKGIKRDQEKM
jgi:hypothetical protein